MVEFLFHLIISQTPEDTYRPEAIPKIHRHRPEDTQTPSRRYTDTLPKIHRHPPEDR
jgi:hypothetical protein